MQSPSLYVRGRSTLLQNNLPVSFVPSFFSSMAMSASTEVIDVATNLQSVQDNIQKAVPWSESTNGFSYLQSVQDNIQKACHEANRPTDSVRLVAVSKTKPIELLWCRLSSIFGENYAQELVEKVPQLPDDIQWHFIGGLQSNKANMLAKAFGEDTDRLTVETVDKFKLANKLNNSIMLQRRNSKSLFKSIPVARKASRVVNLANVWRCVNKLSRNATGWNSAVSWLLEHRATCRALIFLRTVISK